VMKSLELLMDILWEDPWDLPADLDSAIAALPGPGMLPLPWTTWTFIALGVYGERKSWAHGVVETRVAQAVARSRGQSAKLEDVGGRGIVPGLPAWEFVLDSGTGVLVHRPSGEPVHFDLLNGDTSCALGQFYLYIENNKQPGPAVRRLVSLHPTTKALELAFDELADAGLLHSYLDGDFSLCGRLRDLAASVEEFLLAWQDPARRPWLAARIGDWDVVQQDARLGGSSDLIALARGRATLTTQMRVDQVRGRIAVSGLDEPLLHALADAGASDLPAYLRQALEHPGDATVAALELIGDDPGYLPEVASLFAKVEADDSCGDLLDPCAGYLVRQGHRVPEIIGRLATSNRGDIGLTAVLALEYTPDLALALVRRALRSKSSHVRLTVAAALALIDRPWSRGELAAVLGESDDPDATIESRAALRESRDPATRAVVKNWEDQHSEHGEPPWLSDRCVYAVFGGIESSLLKQMDRMRDRILGVRDRIPLDAVED
jgi:hypothetical protein